MILIKSINTNNLASSYIRSNEFSILLSIIFTFEMRMTNLISFDIYYFSHDH
jgi:hypothetical protein